MSTNDITGDRLRSRPNNKAFDDNFDRIFGVKNDNTSTEDDNDNTDNKAKPSGAGNTD